MANNKDSNEVFRRPIGIFVVSMLFFVIGINYIRVTRLQEVDAGGLLLLSLGLLSLLGFAYIGFGLRSQLQEGSVDDAIGWFLDHEIGRGSTSPPSTTPSTEKVPPPTESKKNRIKFDRADRHCEFCGKQSDHLEIHHIRPRAKGGTNRPSNLIALCPECHRKADSSVYSQSELHYQRRQNT